MKVGFVDTLSAVNLVTGGVVVGMVVAELVIILPLIRKLDPAEGIPALRFASFRAWRLAPYFGAVSGFSGIAVLALWPWRGVSAAALLTIVGAIFWVLGVAVTFAWYRPMDTGIRSLLAHAAPTEAPLLFHRMAQFHALRTAFYAAGFACFALGAVLT